MEVRNTQTNKQEYIQANKRTPTDFTQTYGLRFVSNPDAAIESFYIIYTIKHSLSSYKTVTLLVL